MLVLCEIGSRTDLCYHSHVDEELFERLLIMKQIHVYMIRVFSCCF